MITTDAQLNEIKKAISKKSYQNEKVWTYFVAKILENPNVNKKFPNIRQQVLEYLFDKSISKSEIDPLIIGFEVQPLSPRSGPSGNTEGNTHLDLAIGNITNRGKSSKIKGSGIKYNNIDPNMVCFVEAKMFSDLSTGITHDKFRNQMTRVIENLLCFQDNDNRFPDDICFTLLTPRAFKVKPKYRLYGYKFLDYSNDLITSNSLIKNEIEQLKIKKRSQNEWKYPNLSERLKKLRLNWATYEDIFEIYLNLKESIDLLCSKSCISTFNKLTNKIFSNK